MLRQSTQSYTDLSHDSFMMECKLKQSYELWRHFLSQCNGEHFHNMLYNMKPFLCKGLSNCAVQGRGRGLTNQTGHAAENIPLEEEMPASFLSYS